MLETLRHKTIPITFHYNFVGEKTIYYIIGIGVIGIGIGRYENYYIGILSVSADIEKSLSVVHWGKEHVKIYIYMKFSEKLRSL